MLDSSKSYLTLENCKKVLSGISPSVSIMLENLIQDPRISLSPYFYILLLGGFVTFAISLGRFIGKKRGWVKTIWDVTGIALAGFVLVSWARYDSILASIIMEILMVTAIGITCLSMQKAKAKRYTRHSIVYLGLVIAVLFPLIAILPHVTDIPMVVVSPSPKFVLLSKAETRYSNVSVASVYASAWDVRLTAESPNLLAVYLNGREKGPVEIPYLERGREVSLPLRVETSPQIPAGDYNVTLSFRYKDAFGKTYDGSTNVLIIVGYLPPPEGPSFQLSMINLLLIFLSIVGISIEIL